MMIKFKRGQEEYYGVIKEETYNFRLRNVDRLLKRIKYSSTNIIGYSVYDIEYINRYVSYLEYQSLKVGNSYTLENDLETIIGTPDFGKELSECITEDVEFKWEDKKLHCIIEDKYKTYKIFAEITPGVYETFPGIRENFVEFL